MALMDIEFSIWLASKTRWAHLTKTINMQTVPLESHAGDLP
jgi:hypothetical protein